MSPLVLRLLSVLYTSQTLQVRWKSFIGNSFSVSNGVKQGGLLSPVLLDVYIDELLKKMGLVVIWEVHLWVMYHLLLMPTHKGLKTLICICEEYAAEYDIKLNGANSKHMVYKGRNCVVHHKNAFINGDKVDCVVTADHLGHRLSTVDKKKK